MSDFIAQLQPVAAARPSVAAIQNVADAADVNGGLLQLESRVARAWFQRLKLKYDKMLSN